MICLAQLGLCTFDASCPFPLHCMIPFGSSCSLHDSEFFFEKSVHSSHLQCGSCGGWCKREGQRSMAPRSEMAR